MEKQTESHHRCRSKPVVRRADRLLIAPPPPFLHNEKEGLDLRERKVDLVLERGQRERF
jgi:hypothetical protein